MATTPVPKGAKAVFFPMGQDETGCACAAVKLKRCDKKGQVVDGVLHRAGLPCHRIEQLQRDEGPGALEVDKAEPKPTGNGLEVEPVLVELIRQRTALGKAKYGTVLRTRNGRDATMDALQEALDMCQYLTQRVMELQDDLAEARRG
jgi:hypothetical protein